MGRERPRGLRLWSALSLHGPFPHALERCWETTAQVSPSFHGREREKPMLGESRMGWLPLACPTLRMEHPTPGCDSHGPDNTEGGVRRSGHSLSLNRVTPGCVGSRSCEDRVEGAAAR